MGRLPEGTSTIPERSVAVSNSEAKLGINSYMDRFREASLFIDRKFVKAAIVIGQTSSVETLFGEGKWLGWLNARAKMKEFGNGELTPEVVQELNRLILQEDAPFTGGNFRRVAVQGDSGDGGSAKSSGYPITITKSQCEQLKANGIADFTPSAKFPSSEEGKINGYIIYPSKAEGEETAQYMKELLQEVCIWYNKEKSNRDHNPIMLAAQLQQKIVSIHPFQDGNGTLSRLLMNWSLESDGQTPIILEDPDNDLFMNPFSWAIQLHKGQMYYNMVATRQKELENMGINDFAWMFGLQREQTFYQYVLRYLTPSPNLHSEKNGEVSHQQTEAFLKKLEFEYDEFKSRMEIKSKLRDTEVFYQRGLIPASLIDITRSYLNFRNRESVDRFVQKHFYLDEKMFRGDHFDAKFDRKQEQEVLNMLVNFSSPTMAYAGFSQSGYREGVFQTYPRTIASIMEQYNRIIGLSYLKEILGSTVDNIIKKHPELGDITDLDAILEHHTSGDVKAEEDGDGKTIWDSPFVSFSLDRNTAEKWSRKEGFGIVIEARVPKYGTIATFENSYMFQTEDELNRKTVYTSKYGDEYENLVAGSVFPSAIDTVRVFLPTEEGPKEVYVARRKTSGETIFVEVEDKRGPEVVNRRYLYDDESRQLRPVPMISA